MNKIEGATTIRYVYDGWNLIAEYTGATLEKSYFWGMDVSGSMQGAGGVGGLLSVKEGSATYYPTYDSNGNISEYLDVNGDDVAHYEYDAFGNLATGSSGTKKDDFLHRFSTKPLDDETGLYYYGYRYYDPVTGRWPSRDPIGERGGMNLYEMVGNNAINWIDVLGLSVRFTKRKRIETFYKYTASGEVAYSDDVYGVDVYVVLGCENKGCTGTKIVQMVNSGVGETASARRNSVTIDEGVYNGWRIDGAKAGSSTARDASDEEANAGSSGGFSNLDNDGYVNGGYSPYGSDTAWPWPPSPTMGVLKDSLGIRTGKMTLRGLTCLVCVSGSPSLVGKVLSCQSWKISINLEESFRVRTWENDPDEIKNHQGLFNAAAGKWNDVRK